MRNLASPSSSSFVNDSPFSLKIFDGILKVTRETRTSDVLNELLA